MPGTDRRCGAAMTTARRGRSRARASNTARASRTSRRSGTSRRSNGTLYAGVEPAGLFRSDDRGQTWSHVAGLREHPSPAGVAAWRRRAVPALDRAPSHRPRPHVGRHLCRRRLRDHGRRQDLGAAQQGRAGRLRSRPCAGVRPVRAQAARWTRPIPTCSTSRTIAACTDPRTAAGSGPRSRAPCRPTSASRWPSTHTDPATFFVMPHSAPDKGRHMIDGHTRVLRTRDRGETWQSLDNGLPDRRTPTSASCASRWRRPARRRRASTSARRPGRSSPAPTKAISWQMVADFLPPVWSVETGLAD